MNFSFPASQKWGVKRNSPSTTPHTNSWWNFKNTHKKDNIFIKQVPTHVVTTYVVLDRRHKKQIYCITNRHDGVSNYDMAVKDTEPKTADGASYFGFWDVSGFTFNTS